MAQYKARPDVSERMKGNKYRLNKSPSNKKHSVNESYFHVIDDEKKAYYLGLVLIAPKNKNLGMRIYRLGRNFAYALFMGILSVSCVLFYQYVNQIIIVKNEIYTIFVNIFWIFLFIGIIEAILKANKNASTIDI